MHTFTLVIDRIFTTIVVYTVRCIEALVQSDSHQEIFQEDLSYEYELPVTQDDAPHSFKSIQEILSVQAQEHDVVSKNTIMYAAVPMVPVYQEPTIEYDSQIGSIPYGEMVMMTEPRGRFSRVIWSKIEGWALREDLADRASGVYPEFITGQENSVDHPNTVRLRALLGDVFGLGRSEFSLQAGEYVLYRLWKKGVRFTWPLTRPRVPGLWHKILRGIPGVHVSISPKMGSIMEYMLNTDIGHLAYVEAVFPDGTIAISEANYPDSGVYNERELTGEVWRELRPVFINVS